MSTKNRTKEEMLTNNYWEYVFSITKAGFFVTLLNPFEGAEERKSVFSSLPSSISKYEDLRNEIIGNYKEIVNDKDLAEKKFNECMTARGVLAHYAESILPYISLCATPLEKLEEEGKLRELDEEAVKGKTPDYISIYDKCLKLIENIPHTQWENYAKCRLFGILPFGMTKLKYYDMLEKAIDVLTADKSIAYVDKFFRLQEININPKGYENFGKDFINTVNKVEKIASLNAETLTDDGLMEATDEMLETVEFFKKVLENIDELYKDLGLFSLIFCQGYDFEALTNDDPTVRDQVYYVQEIVKKGGFDKDDLIEADKAEKIKNEIIDNFSELIDYAKEVREKIVSLHSSFTGTYKEGLKKIMDFAVFAENLYYGNAEDDLLTDKEDAGNTASEEYLKEKKSEFMESLKAYADSLNPSQRKAVFRKLISTLYIPMENVEFADFFVNTLKELDDKKRASVLFKFEEILDNETANHTCKCGHHNDPNHVCTCDEDGCSCGHDHHDHEDGSCCCCHDDVEEF